MRQYTRLACGLPLENLLAIHLPPLTQAQTIQHMDNLNGPLSRLEYRDQARFLPLVNGHPKTMVIEDIGAYFMDSLWQDLNPDEQKALAVLAVFRIPLHSDDISGLVPDAGALKKLTGYSLLQLESEDRGYVIHPVVREYVFAHIGKEEYRRVHRNGADFLVHKYDDFIKQQPAELQADPLEALCTIMRILTKQGIREEAEGLADSLLEIQYHLFEAEEYEKASGIVNKIFIFLLMHGLPEITKELLKKSIDSCEGLAKYVAMGNLAILLNQEGKWQEALHIHEECFGFFKSINAGAQMATTISQQTQIYQDQGQYEKALDLEQESLALGKEAGNEL